MSKIYFWLIAGLVVFCAVLALNENESIGRIIELEGQVKNLNHYYETVSAYSMDNYERIIVLENKPITLVEAPSVGYWKYCYWKWYKRPGWTFGGTQKWSVECYEEPIQGEPCAVRVEYLKGDGDWKMYLEVESACDYGDEFDWLDHVE